MDPQDTLQNAQEQAEAARVLLNNRALLAAFERLEQDYLRQWQNTSATDVTALQEVKLRQDALTAFRNDLEATVQGGRIAENNFGASRASSSRVNINKNV